MGHGEGQKLHREKKLCIHDTATQKSSFKHWNQAVEVRADVIEFRPTGTDVLQPRIGHAAIMIVVEVEDEPRLFFPLAVQLDSAPGSRRWLSPLKPTTL